MIEGDPIVAGVHMAQVRCIEHMAGFEATDKRFIEALLTIRAAAEKISGPEGPTKHSIALLAEVAAIGIFARQHYGDEPISPGEILEFWEPLKKIANSFIHFG